MTKISVVVLTKNRINQLKCCLDSLLRQTFSNFEIIVIDDSSTDGTKEFVETRFRADQNLKFIQRDGIGIANGRNTGIRNSTGCIVAFIDDDCTAHPEWLAKAVDCMDKTKADILRGGAYLPNGTLFSKLDPESLNFATLNIFYRKQIFEKIGMFDERFVHCAEDRDMGLRTVQAGYKLVLNPEVMVFHPFHYQTVLERLKRLWEVDRYRATNRVLLYKKHHPFRTELIFNVFYEKGHIAVLAGIFLIILQIVNRMLLNSNGLFIFIILFYGGVYSAIYILFDNNIKKYPRRVIRSIYLLGIDMVLTYYTLKGSFRYKFLVL